LTTTDEPLHPAIAANRDTSITSTNKPTSDEFNVPHEQSHNREEERKRTKRSIEVSKGFDKFANELDILKEREDILLRIVKDCTNKERELVITFEQEFQGNYDKVVEIRLKKLKKELKLLRKTRTGKLEMLVKERAKIKRTETIIENLSYKQGEVYFDFRLEEAIAT